MAEPLALPADLVSSLGRALSDAEAALVPGYLNVASAKLRQATRTWYDIDARIALFTTSPSDRFALDPAVVADVIGSMVKRFMVNTAGVASITEATGPYSKSQMFVNRYDKTNTDVRGVIVVLETDLDQLKPADPLGPSPSVRVLPDVVYPLGYRHGQRVAPFITPEREYPSTAETRPYP